MVVCVWFVCVWLCVYGGVVCVCVCVCARARIHVCAWTRSHTCVCVDTLCGLARISSFLCR